MKNIEDMAKSILIQKSPKNLSKEHCRIPRLTCSGRWPVAAGQLGDLHYFFICPLLSHLQLPGHWPGQLYQEADQQALHPHDSIARIRKRRSISFFPRLGYAHKVKKSFDLRADFSCLYQQHRTKENSQFFLAQTFFILNLSKKTLKIKGSFLGVF